MLSALLMLILPAQAHGPVRELLTIHMAEGTARVSLVAPADAFRHADTDADADGLLSTAEVQAARSDLLETLDDGLILSGAERTFGDVLVPGHGDAADHLQLILQYRWAEEPADVMLDYSLFSADEAPMPLLITDTRGDVRRQGELTPALSRAQIRGEAPAGGLRHPLLLALFASLAFVASQLHGQPRGAPTPSAQTRPSPMPSR